MNHRNEIKDLDKLPGAEIEEIMGQVPPAILRYGISVMVVVLLLLAALSWFLSYPDTVKGTADITTLNPPADIVSRLDERIAFIPVSDSALVDSGQILMVLGSQSVQEDIEKWHTWLRRLNSMLVNDSLWLIGGMPEPPGLELSILHSAAAGVNAQWKAYHDLLEKESRFDQTKAESLHRRIREQDELIRSLNNKIRLLYEEGKLINKDFRRDSTLARSGSIAEAELENSRKSVLQHQMAVEEARTRIAEVGIRKGEYQQQLADFLSGNEQEIHAVLAGLSEAVGRALGAYAEWESSHVLRSPVKGRVSLAKYWSQGQEVKAGDKLMNILPSDPGSVIIKLRLPVRGSGLVAPGALVRIRLEDFPAMEYGMLEGEVIRVSAIPDGEFLLADARLSNGLVTTYNLPLTFRGKLLGQAEVTTQNARLIERIIKPIRYILQHQTR